VKRLVCRSCWSPPLVNTELLGLGWCFGSSTRIKSDRPKPKPKTQNPKQRERKEGHARRKRWRDKQQRRFINLKSFGGGSGGGAGENSHRGSFGGGGRQSDEGGRNGGREGSSSPRTPRSPRSGNDLGGLLHCLGSEGAVRGDRSGSDDGAREAPRSGSAEVDGPAGAAAEPSSGSASKAVKFTTPQKTAPVSKSAPSPLAASYASEAYHISGSAQRHSAGDAAANLERASRLESAAGSGAGTAEEEEEQVIVGIITLEDVIECMMQEEIVDEVSPAGEFRGLQSGVALSSFLPPGVKPNRPTTQLPTAQPPNRQRPKKTDGRVRR
jgi:hypothetical protein